MSDLLHVYMTRLQWLLHCAGGNGSLSDPYRLYNLDVFEHAADSPFGLYGSIPFMLAHKLGLSVGAFW